MFFKIEDNPELCTTKDFHDVMRKEGDNTYSSQIKKTKLKEKYRDLIQ